MSNQIKISTFTPTVTGDQLRDLPGLYLSLPCWTRDMAVSINTEEYIREDYTTTTLATAGKIASYILSLGILPLLAALWVIATRYNNELFFTATATPPPAQPAAKPLTNELPPEELRPPEKELSLAAPVEPLDANRPLEALMSEYQEFQDDLDLKKEYEAVIIEKLMEAGLVELTAILLEMDTKIPESEEDKKTIACIKPLMQAAIKNLKEPKEPSSAEIDLATLGKERRARAGQPKPVVKPAPVIPVPTPAVPASKPAEGTIDLRALHAESVARINANS